ncbi:MAG: hypothetical protein R6U96_10375 [Promethearchaeia archaeon]
MNYKEMIDYLENSKKHYRDTVLNLLPSPADLQSEIADTDNILNKLFYA